MLLLLLVLSTTKDRVAVVVNQLELAEVVPGILLPIFTLLETRPHFCDLDIAGHVESRIWLLFFKAQQAGLLAVDTGKSKVVDVFSLIKELDLGEVIAKACPLDVLSRPRHLLILLTICTDIADGIAHQVVPLDIFGRLLLQ